MLMLDHVLLGGAAGVFINSPQASFVFAFGTHFLLDKVPHYFPKEKKLQIITVTVDLLLSFSTLWLFYSLQVNKSILWGAIGGIVIDLVLVGSPWTLHSKIGQWHVKRQPHKENPRYILLDVAIIALCLMIFYFRKNY